MTTTHQNEDSNSASTESINNNTNNSQANAGNNLVKIVGITKQTLQKIKIIN